MGELEQTVREMAEELDRKKRLLHELLEEGGPDVLARLDKVVAETPVLQDDPSSAAHAGAERRRPDFGSPIEAWTAFEPAEGVGDLESASAPVCTRPASCVARIPQLDTTNGGQRKDGGIGGDAGGDCDDQQPVAGGARVGLGIG